MRGGYCLGMHWRETGSVLVDAPQERVFEVLARWMETDPQARVVSPQRLESDAPGDGLSTFILRSDGSRTRVIHARAAPMAVSKSMRAREELREKVEEELQRVQRLVAAYGAP